MVSLNEDNSWELLEIVWGTINVVQSQQQIETTNIAFITSKWPYLRIMLITFSGSSKGCDFYVKMFKVWVSRKIICWENLLGCGGITIVVIIEWMEHDGDLYTFNVYLDLG